LAPGAEISAVTDYEAYFRDEDDKVTDGNGKASHKFTLIRFRDIKLGTDPAYLVQGLIPREGLVVIWGPPKCGKTFWTYDLMMHVALGWPYRGRRVEAGTVVYVACEGERGLAARSEAFRQAKLNGDDDPPFYLLTTRLDLAAEVDQLAFDIAAQIPPEPCAAIVIDTLNRSIRGSESKDEDMSAYIAAADALRERFKCAVIIIHHCGINDTRPRGHTSLTGAVDTQIAVKRDAAGPIAAALEWMKDGPEGVDPVMSRLRVVELGEDDAGETISSCIVEPVDGGSDSLKNTRRKLPGSAKLGLDQLANCAGKYVTDVPYSDHVPSGAKGVPLQLWYKYLVKASLVNEDGNPREQFRRIRVTLQEQGYIGVWDDFVWINT
jgi:hypothetical protein